jgi:predicted  nucleic acid-binding Zn-ribbon protein
MNIDERLEALAQSLELMQRMHQEYEQQANERAAKFEREMESVKERQARLEDNMIVQGELMARLDRRVDEFVAHTKEFVARTEEFVAHTERWINSAEESIRTA